MAGRMMWDRDALLVRKLYKRDDSPVNLLATPEDLNAMNVQTNALVPSTHVGVSCDWRARNTSLSSSTRQARLMQGLNNPKDFCTTAPDI